MNYVSCFVDHHQGIFSGTLNIQALRRLVKTYLASIPPRQPPGTPGRTRKSKGREEQSAVFMGWGTGLGT
jgi:hypothetical protein